MGLRSGFCHFRCTYTARRIRPGTHLSYEEHTGTYPCDGHRCGIMADRHGTLRRSLHAKRTREVVPRCCFDTMSGYTTTGLFLLQDLDHISQGLNMWRHLLTYVGGQGIVVLALTFLIGSTGGAFKIMVGEGKEEKLEPNVRHIAVLIWRISLIYLGVGTVAL